VFVVGDEPGEDASKGVAARPVGAARPQERRGGWVLGRELHGRKIEMRRRGVNTHTPAHRAVSDALGPSRSSIRSAQRLERGMELFEQAQLACWGPELQLFAALGPYIRCSVVLLREVLWGTSVVY